MTKIEPYVGKTNMPDGTELDIVKPSEEEIVAMAAESSLLAEARSRGAKLADVVAYGFLRNPKTKRIRRGAAVYAH